MKIRRIDPTFFFVVAALAALAAIVWEAGSDRTATYKASQWSTWAGYAWWVCGIAATLWVIGEVVDARHKKARDADENQANAWAAKQKDQAYLVVMREPRPRR